MLLDVIRKITEIEISRICSLKYKNIYVTTFSTKIPSKDVSVTFLLPKSFYFCRNDILFVDFNAWL